MKGPTLVLCAALLLVYTPTQADKCRTGCNDVTPHVFKYAEGTTYKYSLEGNVDISLSSAEGQQTYTKIKGNVLLTQQSNCNQVIRLQNLQVIGPDKKKYGGLPNIDKAISINFHDGHVEDEICTEAGDTQHSLNIKRAVASMFQAALNHHHESDVFGDCPTDITSRHEGNVFIIHKVRNLNRCAHREHIKQDFMATSFSDNTEIHSSPLLNGEYESEQRVKDGILDHATVTENYLYKPFSNGKNGAKAVVTTKIHFVEKTKDTGKGKPSVPKSIHFESPHMEVVKTSNLENILHALKETKKSMDISVTENSAKTFAQLIKILRSSKKEDILAIYGQIKSGAGGFTDKTGARKVFFDALFRTGTGDAVEALVQLLKSKELSPTESKLVYLSLSFIRHATPASLTAAASLSDLPDLPREAFLGIGTLAGHYCDEHDCDNLPELKKLMEKLASKLTANPGSHDAENKVIAVLKGIANVRHLSDAILNKLVNIASDGKAPARVRVAALETFLADACKPKLRDAAMKLLKDRQEDSEIRIKAYLVVAKCPDTKAAHALQELLDTEPVYQVGGFIVSHLRNLRASANPDREHAKQILQKVKSSKKFPVDPRKYSFNNEFSYTIDSLGVGSAAESNVIYSQNSFLPRSTNLNLTAEFFGHNFNFLEVGTRQENLDKVLEHYFGPLGVFSTHTPEELYTTGKASIQKLAEHMKQRFEKSRGKRDVSRNDIDGFSKQVKVLGHDLNKDLDLDLSVKILGSEMLFLSINEDIEKLTPDAIIDKMFDCVDHCMEKAKNFEYHMKNHLLFLDVETSYPTSMGFPLRLTTEGASAVHFIAHGSVDIKQLLKDPRNAEMKLSVIPSANIELAGMLKMDAHFVETGLKVASNILTSTGADLTVKILENGKGVDVKLGLPVEKQKIISTSHNIFLSTQELGKPETDLPMKFKGKVRELDVCLDQLTHMIGLTFCVDVNMPHDLSTNQVAFPFNGPAHAHVTILREDVKEYHFRAALTDTPDSHAVEILYDTPGSNTKRLVKLLLEASRKPNYVLRATLDSQMKKAVAEAILTDTEKEKSAMIRFQHDQMEYYGKIGVAVSGDASKQTYKPLIEYHTPNDVVKTKGNRKPDYNVDGEVVVEKGGDKYKVHFKDVKLISPSQPDILVKGYLAKEGHKFSTDMKVKRDKVEVAVSGDLEITSPQHFKLNAEMTNSVEPKVNFKGSYEMNRVGGMENKLVLVHGADLKSKTNKLTIHQVFKHKYVNPHEFSAETKNEITYPALGLKMKLEGKAKHNYLSCEADFHYAKFKLESELEAKINRKVQGDYDVKFELEAMDNKVEMAAKRDIAGDKSTIKNSLKFNERKYEVDGTITHHLKANDINIATDLVIVIHEKPHKIKVNTKLIANNKELDSHAKITMGKETLADIMVKGTKGPNPNGNMKFFVAQLIDASGNFKATDGVGNGHILVDIPKMGRKLKADASFTCKDPTHNLKMDVYFDYEKDNTKKLHVETNNQITQNSVDSKNKIDFLGHKLEGNLKGTMDGKIDNGKINGEFDLHLPNDHYFHGKIDRDLKVENNIANGHGHLTLEGRPKKDGKGYKLDIKAHGKDCNFKEKVMDLTYNIMIENMQGKQALADLNLKHSHDGDKHNSVIKTLLHGSMMPKKFDAEYTDSYTKKEGQYKAHSKYGDNMGIVLDGSFKAPGGNNPISGDFEMEIITPNEKYKSLKLHSSGSVLVPEGEGNFECSGQVSTILNNDKKVSLEGSMKGHKHDGDMKLTLHLPNEEPMSVAGYFKHEDLPEGCKCQGGVNIHYAKDKNVKVDATMIKPNKEELEFVVDLTTPAETAKHINLHFKGKRSNGGKHVNSEVVLTADEKRYAINNELIISEVSPSIDIKISYPDQKTSRIHAKFARLAPKKFTGEIKIESLKDFNLDMDGEANLESIESFHIIMNIHSENLHLNKVKLEAMNKPAKGGKRIQFTAKSGDKNLLSGSTNYKTHEEGGKFIVEGSGSFKVKDQTKSANFRYIRQNLVQEKDGEQGIEIVLNAGLGSGSVIGELKLSNKQFRILNSYCEEKKQCAHVEVFSKAGADDASHFNHELEINIDLRKLGLTHEFGLKAVTNRKNFILDHTVDMHFERSANSKYQYSLYVHPKEAGIVFTMPKRIIALESKLELPEKGKKGTVNAEVAFYMNKKTEPNQKTVLSFGSDYSADEKTAHSKLSAKFSNPSLNKPLSVVYESKYDLVAKTGEFNAELDLLGKTSHKITAGGLYKLEKLEKGYKILGECNVESKGLNLDIKAVEVVYIKDKEFGYTYKVDYHQGKTKSNSEFSVKASPQQAELLLKLLNKDLLHIVSDLTLAKDSQVADTSISAYGLKPMVSHFELKNFNTMIYTIHKKDTPNTKLHIASGFVIGQIADFRAEILKGNSKIDLVHASVKLDDANFMKPDFGISIEHIEKFVLKRLRDDMSNALEELKKLISEYQKTISAQSQHLSEAVKSAMPDLKPMMTYYQNEMKKLKDELLTDKTIQEVSDFLKKIFGATAQTLFELFTRVSEMIEKLSKVLQEHFTKLSETFAKDFLPQLKELGTKMLDFYVSVMKSIYDVTMIYVVKFSEFLKSHQDELKKAATIISDAFQDVGQMVFKSFQHVREELERLFQEVFEQIKALPIFEELKNRYDELLKGLPVPDYVINVINEVFTTVKDMLPTTEMKEFVFKLQEYVTKKLKQEKVDDGEYLKNLYAMLLKAANSFVEFIKSKQTTPEQEVKGLIENMLPLPMDTLVNLPRLVVFKFSPLNLVLGGDLPTVKDFFHAITFNPEDLLPPFEHHAIIIQGQHIFTFDDRHLTFPGVCSYVLAQDVINHNFTIIGTYKDGLMEALTFSDKHDVVTIKKDHTVTLNGAPSELPIRHKMLEVFRLYQTVNVISKTGVNIVCEPHLVGCGVHVSGYYHGQMRGLFGNGNNEPFDDFTLPDGKIVLKEDEFGHAYQVSGACAPVKTVDHHAHHHNPACDALFSTESVLSLCYPFVDNTPFKQACEHGMASGIADTEKAIATAYVAACRHKNIPINTPTKFVKCKNSEQPMDVGTHFSVKVPGKSADIVIVVEQNKDNEVVFKELVQPLVTSLTNDLTQKGITDIRFALIGYGGEYQKWPSHYTSGGKVQFHGKADNVKFVDPPAHAPIRSGNKQFDQVLEKILELKRVAKMSLHLSPMGDAVREAMRYPFRSHAVKQIIVVPGHGSENKFPVMAFIRYYLMYGTDKPLKWTIITPTEIKMKDNKQLKNLIGFNDHTAFTFSSKKSGNQDLRKDIDHDDSAVDFVMRAHGNVFISTNFVAGKPAQRKSFLQVVSHQITDQMTNVEQTMDCVCHMVNPYDAKNECRVTSTREKESTSTKKGVKGK